VVDILRDGGLGVIPTDTCYMFVTAIDSRKGLSLVKSFVFHRNQLFGEWGKTRRTMNSLCFSLSLSLSCTHTCPLQSGVERIYTIKEVESYKKKPLTLLCTDISQVFVFLSPKTLVLFLALSHITGTYKVTYSHSITHKPSPLHHTHTAIFVNRTSHMT